MAPEFRKLKATQMYTFADALLSDIVNGTVVLPKKDDAIFGPIEAVDNSISFNLKMGGYLIALSNGTDRVYQPIATFVKPEWDKTANKYKLKAENVNGSATGQAEAKSMKIASTKTVRENNNNDTVKGKSVANGQIGDSFIFQIVTPIPHYPTKAANKDFIVRDQPTSGLTVTPSSIEVKIGDEKLIQETNYTVEQSDNSRDGSFKVKFDKQQYEDKLASAGENRKELTVEYKGTLNSKAPVKGGTKNSAHPLIPKDLYKPGTEYASPSPAVTEIYTYGVKITKTGKANKKRGKDKPKLQGAEFKLYKGVGNGKRNPVVLKQQPADAGADPAGKYVVQPDSGGATTITSGPGGLLQIDGLGAGTYILEETKAPGGYVLPAAPIAIVIQDGNLDGVPDTATSSNVGKLKVSTIGGKPASVDGENRLIHTLTNKKADFRLPKTGAIGAAIFGVVGVALIVTSAALVIVHRRRKTKRSS